MSADVKQDSTAPVAALDEQSTGLGSHREELRPRAPLRGAVRTAAEERAIKAERLENTVIFDPNSPSQQTQLATSPLHSSGSTVDRTREHADTFARELMQTQRKKGRREERSYIPSVQQLIGIVPDQDLESLEQALAATKSTGNGLDIPAGELHNVQKVVAKMLRNDQALNLLSNGTLSAQERTPQTVAMLLSSRVLEAEGGPELAAVLSKAAAEMGATGVQHERRVQSSPPPPHAPAPPAATEQSSASSGWFSWAAKAFSWVSPVASAIVRTVGSPTLGKDIAETAVYLGSEIKSAWNSAASFMQTVGNAASEMISATVTWLKDPQTWRDIGTSIQKGWSWISNPETWRSAREGISWLAAKAADPATWHTIGSAIQTGIRSFGNWCYDVVTDPQKALAALKSAGSFLKSMSDSLGLTDLAWGVVKMAETSLRIITAAPTMILSTGWNLGRALCGQCSLKEAVQAIVEKGKEVGGGIAESALEASRAIKGATVLFLEVTGLMDIGMCVYYASTGNYAMAAMHGAFALASIGSIAATVGTLGAGAGLIAGVALMRISAKEALKQFGKIALKKLAKEGFELLAHETGERVMAEVVEGLGKKAIAEGAQRSAGETVVELGEKLFQQELERTGKETVERGCVGLAEQLAKINPPNAAKAFEVLQSSVRPQMGKAAYGSVQELLERLDIHDHVKSHVLNLLHEVGDNGFRDWLTGRSLRSLQKRLQGLGVEEAQARGMAVQMRRALRMRMSDEKIVEELTDGITKVISERIEAGMERTFKDQFERALRGTLDSEAGRKLAAEMKRHNLELTEEQIEKLVKEGWAGCREGIEKAVREAVEKAVREAMREYRKVRRRLPHDGPDMKFIDGAIKLEAGDLPELSLSDRKKVIKKMGRGPSGIKKFRQDDDIKENIDYGQSA